MIGEAGVTGEPGLGCSTRWAVTPEVVLLLVGVAVLAVGAATTSGFVSLSNLKAILAGVGILGIVSVGMTCITLSGNLFSLSLGATSTITAMSFLAWLDLGVAAALGLSLLLGVAVCGLQGLLIGMAGANPLVVTIGAGSLQLGIASKLTHAATVYPSGRGSAFLAGKVAGVPLSVFVLAGVVGLVELWLRLSRRGQELMLAGENRPAARSAALRVTGASVAAFMIAGACAAIAGVLAGSASQNATLLSGTDNYTFNAIAVVLIGGVAAAGGQGSPARVVLAAFVIASVSDMALLRGYGTGVQTIVTGVFVLVAIVALRPREVAPS